MCASENDVLRRTQCPLRSIAAQSAKPEPQQEATSSKPKLKDMRVIADLLLVTVNTMKHKDGKTVSAERRPDAMYGPALSYYKDILGKTDGIQDLYLDNNIGSLVIF